MKKQITALVVVMAVLVSFTVVLAATPVTGSKWNKTSLKIYVNESIKTNFSTGIYNAISAGTTSYNSTNAPSAYASSSYIYTWDIYADMADWGPTSWTGLATCGGPIITTARIDINAYGLSSYYSNTNLFKAVTSHEMGHCLGLAHNTVDVYSIMKSSVNGANGFYDYTGGGNGLFLTVPQTVDITAINNIY